MFKSTKMAAPPPRVKVKNAIVSLLLVAALVITGALAFLTAKDSAENIFTVGNVSLVLEEPNWNEENGKNIVGGQTVAKDPQVLNNGTVSAYVYLSVSVPKGEYPFVDDATNKPITPSSAIDLFSYKINDTWNLMAIDDQETQSIYYYCYNQILEADKTTETLFDEISLINLVSGSGAEEQSFNVIINGYGIQSRFDDSEIDTPEEAWNALVNQSGNADLPIVATTVELNFVNALGETAMTSSLSLDKASNTAITIPEGSTGGYNAYVNNSGLEFSFNSVYTASDLLPSTDLTANTETVSVELHQPVVANTILGDGNGDIVKLMPVEGSTIMIDRNGTIESYNEGYETSTEYPYNDSDFSEYIIYGVPKRMRAKTVEENLCVLGNGYAKIYPFRENSTNLFLGTGTIVEVYNANDELVERFTILYYGDVSGHAMINTSDTSIVLSHLRYGDCEFLNPASENFDPIFFKAGDINKDGVISETDICYMDDITFRTIDEPDQITGNLKEYIYG